MFLLKILRNARRRRRRRRRRVSVSVFERRGVLVCTSLVVVVGRVQTIGGVISRLRVFKAVAPRRSAVRY